MSNVELNLNEDEVNEIFNELEDVEGQVVYPAPYSIYVNYPTSYSGGSQPPKEPIEGWVRRNWGELPSGMKEAGYEDWMARNGGDHKEAVAWMVVYAIADSGTDGVYFAERTLDKFEDNKAAAIASKYTLESSEDVTGMVLDVLEEMNENADGLLIEAGKEDTGQLIETSFAQLGDS